jgi:AICAR transformylase/IMP cyclohydrolase PurH
MNRLRKEKKVLQMLERGEEDLEDLELGDEDISELDKIVVEKLIIEKMEKQALKPCVHKKKDRVTKWGPTLVERPRRAKNTGGTIMQKAMLIKKRKNLEVAQGNSFAALQIDYLNQIVNDASIKIG